MNEKTIWLSPKQAAQKIGVSKATIYRYINRKNDPIPSYKITSSNIRINKTELDVWVIRQGQKETIEQEGIEHYE